MQPENINLQPELPRKSEENIAFNPENAQNGLEVGSNDSVEKSTSVAAEREAVNILASGGSAVTSLPAPSLPDINVADTTVSTGPLAAADDDEIEKEWIKKAKETVERTKDDPHARGDATSDLKADYQEKRFNRRVGFSNEAS